ncbi:MAG TPA: hypothetical protein VFF40_04155 [Acidimicrobiia bacterium]|nr:hypothetical protein [Acidimicrobiia bacterium]
MASDKTKMSTEHKAALAEGRANGRAVREYLEALEATKPKRGRKRTPESVKKRLDAIGIALADASGVKRVQLLQERRDLSAELEGLNAKVDIAGVERAFVKAAKSYSESKGIAYATWREAGVSTEVLQRAGLTRGS